MEFFGMPHFRYVASSRDGKIQKGVLEAGSKAQVLQLLQDRGLILMELRPTEAPARPKSAPPPRSTQKAAVPPPSRQCSRLHWNHVQRSLFLRQLQTMFDAGIPLHKGLEILAESESIEPKVQERLAQLAQDVSQGHRLSGAMKRCGVFNTLQVGTVQAGEASGALARLLSRLADIEEKEVELQRNLVSKISYPLVVLVCMSCAVGLLGNIMARVLRSLPNLEPAPGILGLVAKIMGSPWLLLALLAAPVLGFWLSQWVWSRADGRRMLERMLLKIPRLGNLMRSFESARICRLLSALSAAGVRFDVALALAASASASPAARTALSQAEESLRAGKEVAVSLAQTNYFPPEVLQLTAVGEESGQLSEMLARVAAYTELEVERFLESMIALIEPLFMIALGIAVGLTILATFAPVYQSMQGLT